MSANTESQSGDLLGAFVEQERDTHNAFYRRRAGARFTRAGYEERMAFPWEPNFDLYSAETKRFVAHILPRIDRAAPVLDYGCGLGELGMYVASMLPGVKVSAFDISDDATEIGRRMAQEAALSGRVQISRMNAQALSYPSDTFGTVVGHGVLHHVAKYPGTAEELHRVLRPGGRAYFLENLGNGPWGLVRRFTIGRTEYGDVNLTSPFLREWASRFRVVRVNGFQCLFMAKRFFFVRREFEDGATIERPRFSGGAGIAAHVLLSSLFLLDDVLVNPYPWSEWLAGMCILELEK